MIFFYIALGLVIYFVIAIAVGSAIGKLLRPSRHDMGVFEPGEIALLREELPRGRLVDRKSVV